MELNQRVGRREFSRFLRDPRAYRLDILQYEEIGRRGRDSTKRKYSMAMRQKATIREKNRIQSIGREFGKLANLLPDSNGIKRSHQKILHDTVAYIRALEVELKIIDEERLLEKWAVKNENYEGKCAEKDESDLNENLFADEVTQKKIKKATIESYDNAINCGHYTGDVSPSYDYISGEVYHTNYASNFIDYQSAVGNTEESNEHYCKKLYGEGKSKQFENEYKSENEIKQEMVDECDDYHEYSKKKAENDWKFKESNDPLKEEMTTYKSNEHGIEEDCLSFDKVVTRLNFNL